MCLLSAPRTWDGRDSRSARSSSGERPFSSEVREPPYKRRSVSAEPRPVAQASAISESARSSDRRTLDVSSFTDIHARKMVSKLETLLDATDVAIVAAAPPDRHVWTTGVLRIAFPESTFITNGVGQINKAIRTA